MAIEIRTYPADPPLNAEALDAAVARSLAAGDFAIVRFAPDSYGMTLSYGVGPLHIEVEGTHAEVSSFLDRITGAYDIPTVDLDEYDAAMRVLRALRIAAPGGGA